MKKVVKDRRMLGGDVVFPEDAVNFHPHTESLLTYITKFKEHDIEIFGHATKDVSLVETEYEDVWTHKYENHTALVTVYINTPVKYTLDELKAHFIQHLKWCEDADVDDEKGFDSVQICKMFKGKGSQITWTERTTNNSWVSIEVGKYIALYFIPRMLLGTL